MPPMRRKQHHRSASRKDSVSGDGKNPGLLQMRHEHNQKQQENGHRAISVMKKNIVVQITGPQACGKSLLELFIEQKLKELGISYTRHDIVNGIMLFVDSEQTLKARHKLNQHLNAATNLP